MKEWLLLCLLAIIIFISGCVQTQQSDYTPDIITLENYKIGTYGPYSEGPTYIEFDVFHNGGDRDKKVNEVVVNFFDIVGFNDSKTILTCDEKRSDDGKCVFKDLERGDIKKVFLGLTTNPTTGQSQASVSFSVSYDYSGTRVFKIPIVDGKEKATPTLFKSIQTDPTSGPILLDIHPNIENEIKTKDKTVKEYWGVMGRTFDTEFKFTHVGTLKDVDIPDITLSPENVKVTTEKLGPEPCDLEKKTITIDVDKKDEKKSTVVCYFKVLEEKGVSEDLAYIQVDYSYNYKFTKTESFTIFPK